MNYESDRCFRLGRGFLYTGVACTIFFALMAIGSTAMAFWNLDGSFRQPKEAAVVFGVFWTFWTALGIWLIFAYRRYRLCVGPNGIRQVGCFRKQAIAFDGLSRAEWRTSMHPSLVLHGPGGKLTVYFDSFSRAERREIIELLHNRVDEQIQQNWMPFESHSLTPLRPSAGVADSSPS